MTARLTKEQYDVLNAVALKKMATAEAVVAATDLEGSVAAAAVEALAADQLLVDLGGTFMPTDDAVPTLEADAATFYEKLRADADVDAAAERFEPVNSAFLKAMSAWQLVPVGDGTVANDHTDGEYDGKVVDRVDKLVARLGPVIAAFVVHDPRFTCYRRRFDEAMARVDQGQTDFLSAPTVDSVHNVWFEFHEDLLRSLGRERVE